MSAIWAAGLGVGVREFVFGYLFWACVAGIGGSWVVHRAMAAGKARPGPLGKVIKEGKWRESSGVKGVAVGQAWSHVRRRG